MGKEQRRLDVSKEPIDKAIELVGYDALAFEMGRVEPASVTIVCPYGPIRS